MSDKSPARIILAKTISMSVDGLRRRNINIYFFANLHCTTSVMDIRAVSCLRCWVTTRFHCCRQQPPTLRRSIPLNDDQRIAELL